MMAEIDRIKRNISSMIEQSAPESDIDEYVASEGVTAEQLRGAASSTPEPSTGMDVLKQAGSGLASGAAKVAGLLGDVDELVGAGVSAAGDYFFGEKTPEQRARLAELRQKTNLLPTTATIKAKASELTGMELPEAQTTAGEYARTVGEFIPAAMAGPGRLLTKAIGYGAIPGVASEAAGQFTEGSEYEPYARAAGALAGLGVPSLTNKFVTPFRSTPERAGMVDALKREGVETTAGQKTGNYRLKAVESEIGGSRAAELMERQGEQFTSAALRRVGVKSGRATPEVIDDAFDRIGGEFDRLMGSSSLRLDTQLNRDMINILDDYAAVTNASMRKPIVDQVANELAGMASMGAGSTVPAMSGAVYKSLRSRLGKYAQSMRISDPDAAQALRDIQSALDRAMEKSLAHAGSSNLGAWKKVRREYQNMMVIEQAAAGAGESVAMGLISPAKLRSVVVRNGKRRYVRGKGDFAELARSGEAVLKPLPNSGTAPRNWANNLVTNGGIGGLIGYNTTGDWQGALLGAAGGAGARAALSRGVMSPWTQKYLGNQSLAKIPFRDPRRANLVRGLNATLPLRGE